MGASWGPSWGPLGGLPGALGGLLGAFWELLGPLGRLLGAALTRDDFGMRLGSDLEATWSRLVAVLGPSWGLPGLVLEPLGALLEPLGAVLGPLGRLLEPSWSHLGRLQMQIAEMRKSAPPPTQNANFCQQDEAKTGPRWAKMGSSWPKLSPSWTPVGILRRSCRHVAILACLGRVLEATWRQFGRT